MRLLVYGRAAYADPLEELGSLEEGADAGDAFPGTWVELVLVPEADLHWIVRDGKEVEGERSFVRARV